MPSCASKPNIILIITDDLGYADLGCYGQTAVNTPNLDRLAREGVRFTQCYAGSAVCSPSRAVLMTGCHAGHTSVRANTGGVPLPASEETLASVLAEAGYICGGFGKWGLGDVGTDGVPEIHGFNQFFGYYHQVHAHEYFPAYLWRNSQKVELPANADGRKGEYSHDRILQEMRHFIAENRNRLFFCYAPWTLPHGRYELPDNDSELAKYRTKPWSQDEQVVAAMIEKIDRSVGYLMQDLDDLGIAEQTLLIFTSDNGGSQKLANGVLRSNGPLRGGKNTLYEGGIRIPLIARWSGHTRANVSDRMCYFGDFLPTLAELADAFTPVGLDGVSFAAELIGDEIQSHSAPQHEYLYWECGGVYKYTYPVPMQAARKGQWKGIIPAVGAPLELYNLAEDVGEQFNLASAYPEVAAELLEIIRSAHETPREQVEPVMPEGKRYR